ncbi:MAG: sporulation protein YunB [Ruminococcus sp.]|nr:sporulation protein YunB [Ruminococcus sp.]
MQAEHFASASANELIGTAVTDYLDENKFTYSDFSAVLYDENGRAVAVESVPYSINKVQSELTIKINRALSTSNARTERIALGSLTGSYMLVGKGPKIKLRICPSGSAKVELKSELTGAGINQTCHRISAVVTAELHSSVPLYSFDTEVRFEFLLAENVIVGSVPEISRYAFGPL